MRSVFLTLPLLALAACSGKDQGETGETGDSAGMAPTYYQDIAPILSFHCSACHTEGGMNPDLLFDDAQIASLLSGAIDNALTESRMPPFYAEETEECPNPWGFLHDPNPSQEDMDLVAAWAAAGGPEGDADNPAELLPPPPVELEGADLSIYPIGQHTTATTSTAEDEFICFTLDPGLEEQQWLEAYQVLPDNLEVVHHVLVGVDDAGASAALVNENGTYDCFGSFGIEAQFIGGWVPGAPAVEFPIHSAVRVPAGARLLVQMHYHLTDKAEADGTGLALRWAEHTPVRQAYVSLVGNAGSQETDGTGLQPGPNDSGGVEFLIPAGASGHTETMKYDPWGSFPRQAYTFMVGNHMHYIGTGMRTWVERGGNAEDADDACLLETPDWDFDWQQFYFYDASSGNAPLVWPGDELWLQCTYDNTLDNPGVVHALSESGLSEPIDTTLGDGSLSEMCITILGQVMDVPLETEDETHSGVISIDTHSAAFAFDQSCEGLASFQLGDDGSVVGLAACGLDVLDYLLTVELDFSGSVNEEGVASGEFTLGILGLDDTVSDQWSGTLAGDTLDLDLSASGVFSGGDVSFSGSATLTAQGAR